MAILMHRQRPERWFGRCRGWLW